MGSMILKEIINIICTMMKYGEAFYVQHMALNTCCNEVKLKSKCFFFWKKSHRLRAEEYGVGEVGACYLVRK